MNSHQSLLQIVPRTPNECGGVGDYALQLARRLRESHGIESIFLSAFPAPPSALDDFPILSPLRTVSKNLSLPAAILLHYVNYGYNVRGIPIWLPSLLRRLRQTNEVRLVTIFHELYAAGSWRQSAFWLRPIQKQIARSIAKLSAISIVSNETQRAQLVQLAPEAHILVRPVMSNFGEPSLTRTGLIERDAHRWLICGGNELLHRSLASFSHHRTFIPAPYRPKELLVVGGVDSSETRALLEAFPDMSITYHPQVDALRAAELISTCSFSWIDYFHQPGIATETILKSTIFAAICAHGVIPVFPCAGSPIQLGGDRLPGPYFAARAETHLPAEDERLQIAWLFHEWYCRNASSEHLARSVAAATGLAA